MNYARTLEAWLRPHADAEQAGPMKAYMKDNFPFLGIKTPRRAELMKQFLTEHGLPGLDELPAVVRELWALPEREYAYSAMQLLDKLRKRLTAEHLPLLEELIVTKSWWDTVDYLAAHPVGDILAKHPELIPAVTEALIESDDIWLQRTAILFQLHYKQRTDARLLFDMILRCSESKEFFIRKAIGWALREYAKTDPAAVRRFVGETPLSPLSVREALKHIGSG